MFYPINCTITAQSEVKILQTTKQVTIPYTDSKTYDEIEKVTGYERKSIQTFKSIAENVPSSIRMEDVSYGHHQLVAPFAKLHTYARFILRTSSAKSIIPQQRPCKGNEKQYLI